jgi:hypothetical protein
LLKARLINEKKMTSHLACAGKIYLALLGGIHWAVLGIDYSE